MADEASQQSDRSQPRIPQPKRISANKALLVVFAALLVALIVLIIFAAVNYSGAQRRNPLTPVAPPSSRSVDQAPALFVRGGGGGDRIDNPTAF